MSKPILYLIHGLPGSGKSSLAKTLLLSGVVSYYFEVDDHFIRYSSESESYIYEFKAEELVFAHHHCKVGVMYRLMQGKSVAVSNTSTTEKEVRVYQNIAKDCGAQFVSIIVENRHGSKSVHDVPDETVAKMKNRFSVKL